MEIVLTTGVFALAMAGMGVGVLVPRLFPSARHGGLRGSCGGPDVVTSNGETLSCGACPKSEAELCPSDDPLVKLAQIGHPNPQHHH